MDRDRCRYVDEKTTCRECGHRGHLPACRPGFAGGQGRTAEEVASIGASLWRGVAVAVLLVVMTCCAACWGAG